MAVLARDEKVIASLRELIQINIDSFNGFRQAGEELHDAQLARKFDDLSRERWQQAEELNRLLKGNHGDGNPLRPETVSSRIGRTIMDWRRAFGTCDLALLQEAERGEEYIQAKYAAALSRGLGDGVGAVVKDQYTHVQAAHQWLLSASGHRSRSRTTGVLWGRN